MLLDIIEDMLNSVHDQQMWIIVSVLENVDWLMCLDHFSLQAVKSTFELPFNQFYQVSSAQA